MLSVAPRRRRRAAGHASRLPQRSVRVPVSSDSRRRRIARRARFAIAPRVAAIALRSK
jgi:hypothetical protein